MWWGALPVSGNNNNLPTSPGVFQYFSNPVGPNVCQLRLCLSSAPMYEKTKLRQFGNPTAAIPNTHYRDPRGVPTSQYLATRVWGLTSVTQAKKVFWDPTGLQLLRAARSVVQTQYANLGQSFSSGFCHGELMNSLNTHPLSGPHVPHLCKEMFGLQISRVVFWL